MINAKTSWGQNEIELKGNLSTICADTATLLHGIYETLRKKDEDIAEEYKRQMEECLIKCAFHKEEVEEELLQNENTRDLVLGLNKLIDLMKDFCGEDK